MILPSFVLNSKIKQYNMTDGMDQREYSFDPAHYDQYQWTVTYEYNSRGYRDQEWPEDLNRAIWCFGDSFTVGLGAPIDHTWCHCLQRLSRQRIINISMDGASNNWIARKIQELLTEVVPRTIVIQWSYAHRREADVDYVRKLRFFDICQKWDQFYSNIRDPSWPAAELTDFYNLPLRIQEEIRNFDSSGNGQQLINWLDLISTQHNKIDDEVLRLHYDPNELIQDDIDNVIDCVNQVESVTAKHNITVIHSFIPDFIVDKHWKSILPVMPVNRYLEPFKKLDLARDGFHYDLITATYVAEKIHQLIGSARATSRIL